MENVFSISEIKNEDGSLSRLDEEPILSAFTPAHIAPIGGRLNKVNRKLFLNQLRSVSHILEESEKWPSLSFYQEKYQLAKEFAMALKKKRSTNHVQISNLNCSIKLFKS